jgi:hypothetical protein
MEFAIVRSRTGDYTGVCKKGFHMKSLLAFLLVLSLLVVTGTLVAADGKTRRLKQTNSNEQWRQTDVIR